MKIATFLVCLFLLVVQSSADQFSITNISRTTSDISLSWNNVTDNYIVAQSPSLTTGQFQYVGNVLATNSASVSNSLDTCFYRIRKVGVVKFPDSNFKSVVLQALPFIYSPTNQIYDIDGAEAITSLSASYMSISNATGLQALTNLQTLECDNNQLTNLNISACTRLQSLSCYGNTLTNLDVSACTNLQELYCYWNPLTNLNVAGCTRLQGLVCWNDQLTNLNVSTCTNLQDLECYNNHLTNLNVSTCARLQFLSCSGNPLINLDVSSCPDLASLFCENDQLTNLNLSACPNLQTLSCGRNYLTNLDVSACNNLQHLNCWNSPLITHLNLSTCPNLQDLNCDGNNLTNLNLTGIINLYQLDCENNRLTNLDISASSILAYLNATNNPLTEIVVSSLTNLPATFLYSGYPLIREPNINNLTNLIAKYVFTNGTGSTVSDVSGVAPLMDLTIARDISYTPDTNGVTWLTNGLRIDQPSILVSTNTAKLLNACTNTGELSVELWVTPVSCDPNTQRGRMVTYSTNGGRRNFSLMYSLTSTERFGVRLRTTDNSVDPANYLNGTPDRDVNGAFSNQYTHVVYTRNAVGKEIIFVNGTNSFSQAIIGGSLTNWDSSYTFALANEATFDRYFLGTFRRVAIYSKALQTNEVTYLYQNRP